MVMPRFEKYGISESFDLLIDIDNNPEIIKIIRDPSIIFIHKTSIIDRI